jgi:hypothetical protein
MKSSYDLKMERRPTSTGEQLALSNNGEAVNGPLLSVHLGYELIILSVYNRRK